MIRRKKLTALILTVAMIITMAIPAFAFADTGFDKTPPIITGFKLNTSSIDAGTDKVSATFNIKEDGVGVQSLSILLRDTNGSTNSDVILCWEAAPGNELFTGTHTIEFGTSKHDIWGTFKKTIYEVDGITVSDVNELFTGYDSGVPKNGFTLKKQSLKVTGIPAVKPPAQDVKSVKILSTDNVDASGYLDVEVEVGAPSSPEMQSFNMYFQNLDDYDIEAVASYRKGFSKAGKYKIKVPMEDDFYKGKYRFSYLETTFVNDDRYYSGVSLCGTSSRIINVTKTNKKIPEKFSPKLNSLKLMTTSLNTPGVLKAEVDFTEVTCGVKQMKFLFIDEEGNDKCLRYSFSKPKNTGKYTVSIPVGQFFYDGKLKLTGFQLYDDNGNSYNGFDDIQYSETLTISSGYNITYYGSLANSNIINVVKAMKAGQTAVLDCRRKTTAPKALFSAIAGKDITLVFINDDVQWVMNGKSVSASKCKDVKLTCDVSVVNGYDAGFAQESKVIRTKFADNGQLPGVMEMRVNGEYMVAKYKFDVDDMSLYYLDGTNIKTEKSDVNYAKDNYIEYNVSHNSTFVLSESKANLGAVKNVKVGAMSFSSLKISWSKMNQASGYYVYRSTTGKKGKYKKIATVKGASRCSYTSKGLKKGKTYYYKVKAYNSKSKTLSKTAKYSSIVGEYPRLRAPKLDNISQGATKPRLVLYWTATPYASKYYVYRSETKGGKYKKIATTVQTQYFDKKIKKNKIYYYMVKAIYGGSSKYNSRPSTVKGDKYWI